MSKMKVINAIKRSEQILVVAHMNPDLDALCSQLAVATFCQQLGKKVTIVNNCEVPSRYAFLPGMRQIKKMSPRIKANFDAAIVLDSGEMKRIGKVQELITEKTSVINIDHHVSNDSFGDINYIDAHASSTCEIVYDLVKTGKCTFNKNLAIQLYVGILTDTGSFRYSNTSSKTHQIVSDLLSFEFSADKLYRQIYESMPFNDFSLFAKVVGDFQTKHNQKVIYFEFDKKTQDRFSKEFDLRDTTLNFLRLAKGIDLIIIFSVIDSQRTRVNFRSTDHVNVAKLAETFNGGGHKRASGCMMDLPIAQAKKKVLSEVTKLFK